MPKHKISGGAVREARRVARLCLGPVALGLACLSGNAGADIITLDFEGLAGDVDMPAPPLITQGFVLDPGPADAGSSPGDWVGNHYHIAQPTHPIWANNGTRFMVVDYEPSDVTQLTVRAVSGGLFGVQQIDLAEALSAAFGIAGCQGAAMPNPYVVGFSGRRADGTTIATSRTLDMICDGNGPLTDFQTFTLDGQWNLLSSFSVRQLTLGGPYSWLGIDNIVLRPVSSPGTLAVAALGLLGIALARRRTPSRGASGGRA